MIDFSLEELRMLATALHNYTSLSDERSMMFAGLQETVNGAIEQQEELLEFAGECEGGACKL